MQPAAINSYTTRNLPSWSKGTFWVDVVNRHIINLDCPADPETGIDASLDQFDLGDIRFNHIRADSHSVQRSNAHINHDGREAAFMCLILEGSGFACQGIRGNLFNVGDVLIYNTVHPYSLGFPDETETMVIDLPHTILKEYFGSWNQKDLIHLDRTLDVGGYSTANLFSIVQSWMQQDSGSNGITSHRLLEQLHGLMLQRTLGNNSRSLPRLLQKSKVFINQHLHQEQLSAELISQHLHTSSRQLARAFALEGSTVSRYIWNQRLERCRQEIQASTGTSISEIAFRWGFNHSAHFSRSYKQRFGETPTATRQRPQLLIR